MKCTLRISDAFFLSVSRAFYGIEALNYPVEDSFGSNRVDCCDADQHMHAARMAHASC